jgi:hypothetical protein
MLWAWVKNLAYAVQHCWRWFPLSVVVQMEKKFVGLVIDNPQVWNTVRIMRVACDDTLPSWMRGYLHHSRMVIPQRLRTWRTAGADPPKPHSNHVEQTKAYSLILFRIPPNCFCSKSFAHTFIQSLEWFLLCTLFLKKERLRRELFESTHFFSIFTNLNFCPRWSHIRHPWRYSWIMWRDTFWRLATRWYTPSTGLQFFTNVIAF